MNLKVSTFPYLDSARLFDRVADQHWALYFDSGHTAERQPRALSERYDVLAIKPAKRLITKGASTQVCDFEDVHTSDLDPLELLKAELAELRLAETQKHPYLPGAYGYFSYDLSRRFEAMPMIAEDDEALPEMAVGVYLTIVVIDHQERATSVLSVDHDPSVCDEWQVLIDKELSTKATTHAGGRRLLADSLSENQSRAEYQCKFDQIRRYTIEGDCYQVNLTKRFACEVSGSAWATYRNLREASPAPFGAFMHFPFAEVLSNSPESFIRCRDREITTSPIKGTRPRDHDDVARDREIAQQLADSEKDRAENLMIVDLMRNDLGRCSELGSVQVPKLFELHSFANVHHLISTVTARLRAELHALDLLRSCFPGGSITGAPKIRAMEIIEELEPHRRGLYCGAIGYVGIDGDLETSIAIRTIVVKEGVARFSAGGGLVIDSNSDEEYQELLDKASMMKGALLSG